jgi:hypothetical protein
MQFRLPPSIWASEIRFCRSVIEYCAVFSRQFHDYWHSDIYTVLQGVNEFLPVIFHTPWPTLLQFGTRYGHVMPFCSFLFYENRCIGTVWVKGLNETLPYFVHLYFSWMNLGTEGVHQQSPIECGFGESVAVLSELPTLIVQCYDNQHRRSARRRWAPVRFTKIGTGKAALCRRPECNYTV